MSEIAIPAEIEVFVAKHLPIIRTYADQLDVIDGLRARWMWSRASCFLV